MPPTVTARLAKAIGFGLVVVSVATMAYLVWVERDSLARFQPSPGGLAVLAVCGAVYAGLGVLLAAAWRLTLLSTGEPTVPVGPAVRVYARSQIAKYLPGNIVQFAGRQMLGRKYGWSHTGLLLSTLFELGSMVLASSLIAAGLAGLVPNELPAVVPALAVGIVIAGVAVVYVAPAFVSRRWPDVAGRVRAVALWRLWAPFGCHLVFFAVTGLLVIAINTIVSGSLQPIDRLLPLWGVFSVAWTAGTLAPGAPSGVGVREVVLVAGLSLVGDVADAVLVAALLRVITVAGDLLFFGAFAFLPVPDTFPSRIGSSR